MKIEFGEGHFVFNNASNKLTFNGEAVHLTDKECQVLLELINNSGVVTRDELYQRVWGTTYKSDSALSRVIKELRKKLGDDAYNSQFIKTVKEPVSGYQFIASLTEQTLADVNKQPATGQLPRILKPVIAVVFIAVATFGSLSLLQSNKVIKPSASISMQNITLPKRWYFEISVSHDQNYLAYLGNELGNRSNKVLYLTANTNGYPVLAEIPNALAPVFDSTNQTLAYAQVVDEQCELATLTLEKEPVRRTVAKCEMADGDISIAWAPEGNHLYVAESGKENLARGLYRYSIETGIRENVLSSKFGGLGIYRVYSVPDRDKLLLIEGEDWIDIEVYLLDLITLKREKVTSLDYPILSAAVFEDGLVIRDSQNNGLVKIDYATASRSEVLGPQSEMILAPKSVASHGLSFISGELYNIEIVNSATDELLTEGHVDYYPVVNGDALYFASRRSGRDQIWKLQNGIMSQITELGFSTVIYSYDVKKYGPDEFIAISTSKGIVIFKNAQPFSAQCGDQAGATHGRLNNDASKLLYAFPVEDAHQLFECELQTGKTSQLTTQGALVGFYTSTATYFVDTSRESLYQISADGQHQFIGGNINLMNPHHGVMSEKVLYFTKRNQEGLFALDLSDGNITTFAAGVRGAITSSSKGDIIFARRKVVSTNPKLLILKD